MAVSEEQIAADEREAIVAVAAMLSDASLIADFGVEPGRSKTTMHKYKQCLHEFSDYLVRGQVLPSLLRARRADVLQFLKWLEGDADAAPLIVPGKPKFGRHPAREPLSASSRKGYLSALRAFYYFCLDQHLIDYDPTAGVRSPRIDHAPGMTLEAEELQEFLDAPGSERDRVQAYLFVFTAQRAGALRNLRWRDVDFKERELTFRNGKLGKTNVLPMHDELLGALSRWRRVVLDMAEKNPLIAAALYNDDTAFVLLTRAGRPVTVQTLGKQVKWRAARCGLRPHTSRDVYHENKSEVHPHAFRRSWATLQRRRGIPLEDIADVLAHSSIDTTRKHYAFPPSDAKRRAVKNFSL